MRASAIYMISLVVGYGLRFGSLRIFTNILSPGEIGTVAIWTSWVAIFSIIINLNVRSSILNGKKDFTEDEFSQYISSIVTLGFLASLVCSVLIIVLPDLVYDWLFGIDRSMIALALLVTTVQFGLTVTLQIWRSQNDAIEFGLQTVFDTAYSIILSIILIQLSMYFGISKVSGRIIGANIVALLMGAYFLWKHLATGRVFFHREYWHYALVLSVPLMGHLLSTQVLHRADQILILNLVGEYETGIYSLIYRIAEIPSVFLTASGSVWAVWFFDRMKNEEYDIIQKRSFQYALGFAGIIIFCIIAGIIALRLVTTPEYWVATRLIPVISAGYYWFMLYSIHGNAEQYDKQTGYLAIATFIAAVFNVVSNWLLIPDFGYEVAAWTTLFSYLVMAIIHIGVVRYIIKRPYLFPPLRLILSGMALTGIAWFAYITL